MNSVASEPALIGVDWGTSSFRAFLIGSEVGLDDEVTRQARSRLSLGPMILGHELARLVLYEQLYRSIAINRGIKYHRPAF